jgi:hypothetical protein
MNPTRGTNSLPQMTAAEFAAAMKHHGFGVNRRHDRPMSGHFLASRAPGERVGGPEKDVGEDPS